MLSFMNPIHECTKMSYIINIIDTGTDIIFVIFGFLHHRDRVTHEDAVIGNRLTAVL